VQLGDYGALVRERLASGDLAAFVAVSLALRGDIRARSERAWLESRAELLVTDHYWDSRWNGPRAPSYPVAIVQRRDRCRFELDLASDGTLGESSPR
jgi:hypothetical protein